MKRRDRVMECTIAAIAGIGIAAILTASLGVRSSKDSTPLKSEAATAAKQSTVADVRPSKAARPADPARKRQVHRHHRRRTHVISAPAPPPAPVVAEAAPVKSHAPAHSAPIRTVSVAPRPAPAPAPAPKPAPTKPPSRPKSSGGGGVSFDDSG
jgi:hypothetical protein